MLVNLQSDYRNLCGSVGLDSACGGGSNTQNARTIIEKGGTNSGATWKLKIMKHCVFGFVSFSLKLGPQRQTEL